jgi:hypothetical protein
VEAADFRPPESPRCLWYYRLEFEKSAMSQTNNNDLPAWKEADAGVSRNSSIEFPA